MPLDHPTAAADRVTIERLVVERQKLVYDWFKNPSLKEGSARAEGERRVALGALEDRLSTFARLLDSSETLTAAFMARSTSILRQLDGLDRDRPRAGWAKRAARAIFGRRASLRFLDVDVVREVAADLDLALLELASAGPGETYVRTRLEEERRLDARARTSRRDVSTALSWSDLYDRKELEALLPPRHHEATADTEPAGRSTGPERALELLSGLYQARRAADRRQRAQEQLRTERLQWVAALLVLILVSTAACLAVALAAAAGGQAVLQAWIAVPLALLMGALGAGLASASVLREEPVRADSLPRFKAAFFAQLPIGGTFGLVALALLRAGVLPAFQGEGDDLSVVALVIYAFLAGYSEPFVLGILRGLSGRGEPDRGHGAAPPGPSS